MDNIKFKLQESTFYCEKLKSNSLLDPDRRYYLSAFLTAAYSVTYYLRHKYKNRIELKAWLDNEIDGWLNDSDLAGFRRRRNSNVHDHYLTTETTASVRQSNQAPLLGPNDEVPVLNHPSISLKGHPSSPHFESWIFTDECEGEVLQHCESIILELKELVEECTKRFA